MRILRENSFMLEKLFIYYFFEELNFYRSIIGYLFAIIPLRIGNSTFSRASWPRTVLLPFVQQNGVPREIK